MNVQMKKQRNKSNEYITQLYKTELDLGFSIIEHRMLEVGLNPYNPTVVMVIEKIVDITELNDKQSEEMLCYAISKKVY